MHMHYYYFIIAHTLHYYDIDVCGRMNVSDKTVQNDDQYDAVFNAASSVRSVSSSITHRI